MRKIIVKIKKHFCSLFLFKNYIIFNHEVKSFVSCATYVTIIYQNLRNLMNNYHVYHLSHTDLDGYGCQIITSHFFDNISFFNSNYGKEITERFNEIVELMEKNNKAKNIILITDLNLTKEQCEYFEKNIQNASVDAKLILLDHHKSGQECFEKFDWYYLDDLRCATKITYQFFASMYGQDSDMEHLTNVINAVDIWLSDDKDFELGKVCLGLVANAREINRIMFASANNKYIFSLLKNSIPYFSHKNAHIALDSAVHEIKKEFFKESKDDTLSNLVSTYMVKLLTKYKQNMTIKYGNYQGILTYNIGNVSVIGNDFLVKNEEFDFFMDVTSRKTVSFRSNGKANVSDIAKKIANGGGHPNASGGALTGFKDSFLYPKVHAQIKAIIQTKLGE